MDKIAKFLPFLAWIHEIKDEDILKADLVAGLTVALVLVPQSMAYAQLAGLAPQYGLYASFLPVMIAALMGSSRQLGTGPVAVVSLLTAAAIPTIPAILSFKRVAIIRLIQPPMDEPTKTCGPLVRVLITSAASCAQSPIEPSVNAPDDAPCPE